MNAKERYNKNHYEQYTFTLNKEKDVELIKKIERIATAENKSKAAVIKELLYGHQAEN